MLHHQHLDKANTTASHNLMSDKKASLLLRYTGGQDNRLLCGLYDNLQQLSWQVSCDSPLGVAEIKLSKKVHLILDLSSPHDDPSHCCMHSLIRTVYPVICHHG